MVDKPKAIMQTKNGMGFIIGSIPFFGIGVLGFFIYQYFNQLLQNSDEITELIGNIFIFSSLGQAGLIIGIVSFSIGIIFILFGIYRKIY